MNSRVVWHSKDFVGAAMAPITVIPVKTNEKKAILTIPVKLHRGPLPRVSLIFTFRSFKLLEFKAIELDVFE